MKKLLLFLLLLPVSYCQATYQDTIINSKVVGCGSTECASRYEALVPLLKQYTRPFTVLDIGASEGYFSFRMAAEFDATCVMIEGNYGDDVNGGTAANLETLCQKNSHLKNIVLLKKHVTPEDLKKLSECEHFDVVLALNIVHHFGPERWKEVVDAILNMGDHIIIETPPADDCKATGSAYAGTILHYLQSKKGRVIGRFARATNPTLRDFMFQFSPMKNCLQRISWNKELPPENWHDYHIQSSFAAKTLHKHTKKEHTITSWVPGINLRTFKKLNGVYPSKADIRSMLFDISTITHNDFKLWNLVIQGKKLAAIDENDPNLVANPYARGKELKAVLDAF